MKTLIFGAGNLLLSDEGFGVHAIRYLEENYDFPDTVELYDGGTLGIMVTHKFEEADKIFLVDIVDAVAAAVRGLRADGVMRRLTDGEAQAVYLRRFALERAVRDMAEVTSRAAGARG